VIRKLFGGSDFWKPTLRLAIPVALQNLLTCSFSLVDTIMLGQLGDVAVASVGMAGQWTWLINVLFFGLTSGSSVFLAQYWGAKDMAGVRRTYGLLLTSASCVGFLASLLAILFPSQVISCFTSDAAVIASGVSYLRIAGFSYLATAFTQIFCTVLRSTEEVRLPLVVTFISVILNAFLNYGLIFGRFGLPEMGVRGAALATAISAWVSPGVLFIISAVRKNVLICPRRQLFAFDGAFVKKFLRISIPVLLNEGLWSLGMIFQNMVYGHMGTSGYAALTISKVLQDLFFVFFAGMGHASAVLVGKEIGAGYMDAAVRFAKRFVFLVPTLAIPINFILILARSFFLGFYSISDEVYHLANLILLLGAIESPLRYIPYVTIIGVFRPGGDTRTGLYYDLIMVYGCSLPLSILLGLVFHLPFPLVYAAALFAEDGIKVFLCLRRTWSLKWIQPVVDSAGSGISSNFS